MTRLRIRKFIRGILPPLLAIVLVGSVGTYVLSRSKADPQLAGNGPISYNYKQFINSDGSGKGVTSELAYKESYERTFSPTGKQFAYLTPKVVDNDHPTAAQLDTRYPSLSVANSDGSAVKSLLDEVFIQNNGGRLSWSADGTWIAFGVSSGSTGSQVFTLGLVHPDGTEYHTVPGISLDEKTGFFGLSFAHPNILAYVQTDSLCTVNIDGSAKNCHSLPSGQSYSDPQVSPDGTKVLLRVGKSGAGELQTYNVAIINIDGSQFKAITAIPAATTKDSVQGDVVTPTWSPDGKLIAYGISGDPATNGLYVSSPDGTGVKRIDTVSAFGIAWQPVIVGEVAGKLAKSDPVATCTINNLPANLVFGSVLNLTATITNKTTSPLSAAITLHNVLTKNGQQTIDDNVTTFLEDLAPGATNTVEFPAFTVPYGTSVSDTFTPTLFSNSPAISCSTSLPLPIQ